MTESEKYAAMVEDLRIALASPRVKRAWGRFHTFLVDRGYFEAPDPPLPDCVVEGEEGYVRVDK